RGIQPLALGREAWQLGILFEIVALGEGGADFYRRAFIERDAAALSGPTMVRVLERFAALRPYVASKAQRPTWHQAAAQLRQGQAAMLLMGDWVKSELSDADGQLDPQLGCQVSPGSQGLFSYNLDSIALFKQRDESKRQAQDALAALIVSPAAQQAFNRRKGSLPALSQTQLLGFDRCAKQAHYDFTTAAAHPGQLLPSVAEGMAGASRARLALINLVSHYFDNPAADAKRTAHKIARAMQIAGGPAASR
ncbi:MAG: extracellular solute-binding protein, partial [Aeromonas sp.]